MPNNVILVADVAIRVSTGSGTTFTHLWCPTSPQVICQITRNSWSYENRRKTSKYAYEVYYRKMLTSNQITRIYRGQSLERYPSGNPDWSNQIFKRKRSVWHSVNNTIFGIDFSFFFGWISNGTPGHTMLFHIIWNHMILDQIHTSLGLQQVLL